MGNVPKAAAVIIPGKEVVHRALLSRRPIDRDAAERTREIVSAISAGRPVAEVVEMAMSTIADLFGLTGLLLEVTAEDIRPTLRFVVYGYPTDKAEAIIENLSGEYFPKTILSKIMSESFRISKNGYFVPAEEWAKIAEEEPCADHPAYYMYPENARAPRQSPDEFHESDFYRFAIGQDKDALLGYIDIYYSVDDKRPSQETIEAVELYVDLIGLALKRERLKLQRELAPAQMVQRTDLLEDVLKIASSIVSERELTKLSQMVLSSVSSLFGFGKVSLIVYDETDGAFHWMAVFGYPDRVARDAMQRTIPTDVVLEDLRENRRIGKSAYFTPGEELSQAQLAHFVVPRRPSPVGEAPSRDKGQFLQGDCLAFSLHDSTGRIVGVIYPSDPKDGRLPDNETIETMEVFASLAEVAVENARLTIEREQALRLSNQKMEQLSRILDITSRIMYVRDLDQMLEDLLKTLAVLLGIKRMVIGVKYPSEGVYKVEAVYGYIGRAADAINKIQYPVRQVDSLFDVGTTPSDYFGGAVKWRKKIGRMTYYMPAEGQVVSSRDSPYYPDADLVRLPRRGKGHWHELDYMDTFVLDRSGDPIAYLEILKPRDERVPDSDTIEIIEIFATLAGIAIENSKMFQEHIDSRRDAELYTDVLSHDIKNFNQAILGYLEMLRSNLERPENLTLTDKILDQVMNTNRLASNVRTLSRLTFGDVDLSRMDLGAVLLECQRNVDQYNPARKITCTHKLERGVYFTRADELLRELFTNLLTNAVKYDSHDEVQVGIEIERKREDDQQTYVVSVIDHGRGVPDDVKAIIFDRFSKAPRKKGSGLGLHIVKTLATRYGGKVWIEDRVPGDHTQGSVFRVQLPAAS